MSERFIHGRGVLRTMVLLISCLTMIMPAVLGTSKHRMNIWNNGDEDHHGESSSGGKNGGNCHWQKDWLQLDPDWSERHRPSLLLAPRHFYSNPPILEPMKMDEMAHRLASSGYSFPHPVRMTMEGISVASVMRLGLHFGATARLPCPVRQLQNRTVSWLKHTVDSVQLLTVGNGTYTNDPRLSVAWRYPGNWTLVINQVDLQDSGCYQVNTHPPISLFIHLDVQGPAVTIVDDRNVSIREAVFKQGALIRLVCLVRQADRESFPVQWRLGPAQVFNHDTQRGGVSVKTERQGRDAISWLLMVRATSRDSGLYTCSVDGRSHANVSVHVIQGETQAAVQELTTSGSSSSISYFSLGWIFHHSSFLVLLCIAHHFQSVATL